MRVGVFDSGLGGLTVVDALRKVLKGAHIIYVADTKHAPYGEKTPEQILAYSQKITYYLIHTYQIDALILACNTATSAAIQHLRHTYPELIIIGTEPGIKPAIAQTKTGKIGVLATPATLKGEKYQELATTLSRTKDVELFGQACPGLVEQIEAGQKESAKTRDMLEGWLAPMREAGVDTIVLGCTHYPLVEEMISEMMQNRVNLIHTGDAIAKHLLSLSHRCIGHVNEGSLTMTLQTTGPIQTAMVEEILQEKRPVELITIAD